MPGWFYPFANQAAITWMASLVICLLVSGLSKKSDGVPAAAAVTLWDSAALLKQGLGESWHDSVILWCAGFVIAILGAMAYFSGIVFPAR